ncbi:MAG: homocysteine S-methyltransferase family protein [Candidatus Omnitrophota bacterium]
MKTFEEKLETDIILLDGAFGTYAQEKGLSDGHFRDKPGCMEYLSLVSPDFVAEIHKDYLEAGADAVETNTFGANSVKLAEYGLEKEAYNINFSSAKLARRISDKFSNDTDSGYVVGTMGPTGKLPSSSDPVLGNITYRELKKVYKEQALGLIDGGVDAIVVETGQDILEMKASVAGANEALKEKRKDLAVMAQCTLANNGRMLLGTEISGITASLSGINVDVIGLNCSTGPVEMESALKFLSENSPTFISCIPNAGMPVEKDGKVTYPLNPDEMAGLLKTFLEKYRINVIGGCCGTSPEHIRAIKKILTSFGPRKIITKTFCGGFYSAFDIKTAKRPIKVGERINTQGSRRMKQLLKDENYDEIVELGKLQEKQGSDILDVCSVLTERNTEERDAAILMRRLGESVEVPLMIDSTNVDVIGSALESYPGTAIINSVNLEDGGEKARRVFGLAAEHGSFVVCLVIDEKGMAKTVKRKMEIARRLYDIATGEYGINPSKLIFDTLTFSLGTGEEEYRGSAINTFEGIKALKQRYPEVLTVLGVSNVSFGFSPASRKPLNMAFLGNAVKCGLDMAIVNPAEYVEYEDIPAGDRKIAEDLIFNKGKDTIERFLRYFADRSEKKAKDENTKEIGIEERIKRCIFERNKTKIISLLDEALKTYSAEDIMNDILMDAMKEVGDRLEKGETVLPYVLQSAEVMKKGLEHLEKFLKPGGARKKGKVLLATVFGDVHDIGKNLVKMVLENNGFSVIDLGKQVPIERIVEEAKKNKVDAVGLSALLVSTARHMKTCIQSMHDAGLDYPVLIGGAPTNKRFAEEISLLKDESVYSGGVFYSKDVFSGLAIMNALRDPAGKKRIMEEYKDEGRGVKDEGQRVKDEGRGVKDEGRKGKDEGLREVPRPPFYGIRSLNNIPIDEVFAHLDENMLFKVAWGVKMKDEEKRRRFIEEEGRPILKNLKKESLRKGWFALKSVYGFYKCRKNGKDLLILDGEGKELEVIHFGKEDPESPTALTDYFMKEDVTVFQAVTVGDKINAAIDRLNEKKEVTKAFFLHGLSVHLAEALASYMHDRIRKEWGLKKDQGKRYSPGFPLWKDLSDQVKIFDLLEVEKRIGIKLTEAYQMIPEQSTTAMIVHNSKAKY